MVPRYFGPYPVAIKKSSVAYTLVLPVEARVHPTFHVSQPKRHIGSTPNFSTFPPVDVNGALAKVSIRIVEVDTEVLVEWTNAFPEDSTWERLLEFQQRFSQLNL